MGRIVGVLGAGKSPSAVSLCVNLALSAAAQMDRPVGLTGCEEFFRIIPENILRSAGNVNVHKKLSDCAGFYDCVILGLNHGINEENLNLLDACGAILMLTAPDAVSLARARLDFEELLKNNFSGERIKFILNFSGVNASLNKKSAEDLLKRNIFHEIPFDPDVFYGQLNGGEAAVLSAPYSPYSRSVKMLARNLLEWFAQNPAPEKSGVPRVNDNTARENLEEQITRVHERFLREVNLKELEKEILAGDTADAQKSIGKAVPHSGDGTALRKNVSEKISLLIEEECATASRAARSEIVRCLLDDILGLGPLEPLLKDQSVSEIMVNGKDTIFVEKQGKLSLSGANFSDNRRLMIVIERILSGVGRKIDESTPLVDARLKDGSRVNVIIPPLSLIGPCMTIRKFPDSRPDIEFLITAGSLSREMAGFLSLCVRLKKNIVLSGGTGSGKTTLLNIISSFIPEGERIITIEDSAELRLCQKHVISLESRPANLEGAGEIPIRRLVINALRMRPDRIVVGECRGGEALDMLQAMNTGHEGSMTTLHANTPKDAISRLLTMAIMSGSELPEKAIREQISAAVDIIVQVARLDDGTRKIRQICELSQEGDVLNAKEIFRFRETGVGGDKKVQGVFEMCGAVEHFLAEARVKLGEKYI